MRDAVRGLSHGVITGCTLSCARLMQYTEYTMHHGPQRETTLTSRLASHSLLGYGPVR
jgi:hypothetical protein